MKKIKVLKWKKAVMKIVVEVTHPQVNQQKKAERQEEQEELHPT